ncbi:pilus assembly protein PilM [Bacillaceae bacterium S4-13-56]
MSLYRRTKSRLHVIIKDHVVRYVINHQPKVESIISYGEIPIPKGVLQDGKIMNHKAFVELMKGMVEKERIHRSEVFFTVPDATAIIRTQGVPKGLSIDEIKGYLYLQIGNKIHLPFSNPIINIHRTNHVMDEEEQVLLFAFPAERLRQFQLLFKELTLNPVVADLSTLSLYRLYVQKELAETDEYLLSVQWNVDSIVLTVFHESHPVFFRHMKSTLPSEKWVYKPDKWIHSPDSVFFWKGEKGHINGYVEDKLLEIERFMNFYKSPTANGEASINKIILTGDFPELEGIIEKCRQRFKLPINDIQEDITIIPKRYVEALGLAIKPVI